MRIPSQSSDVSPDQPVYRVLRPRVVPLDQIHSSDLPRDRLDLPGQAGSAEMQALKASLSQRGQRAPVTVSRDQQGRYQLVSGWRRLTALQQLAEEQGLADPMITARLTGIGAARMELYIDMVESNLLHQGLSFGEMAQLALTTSADPALSDLGVGEVVTRLYGALPKMKRSYIRRFVYLLQVLGDGLRFPHKVSRNQGVAVSRQLKNNPETAEDLRQSLSQCPNETTQSAVFAQYLLSTRVRTPQKTQPERRFHLGKTHVTGRMGECVIRRDTDFSRIDTAVLSRAIQAFERILQNG